MQSLFYKVNGLVLVRFRLSGAENRILLDQYNWTKIYFCSIMSGGTYKYKIWCWICSNFFNWSNIPSVDKGKHGFSELKQHSASFSSLPGGSPAASSASLSRRFRSRKTPKDFPASKNGRWCGSGRRLAGASQGQWQNQRLFRPLESIFALINWW